MLVKSFKVAFSSLEMAQRSILSMLQKTNHDKNRTGNPVQSIHSFPPLYLKTSEQNMKKSLQLNNCWSASSPYAFRKISVTFSLFWSSLVNQASSVLL